ncbi:MAG: MMPL family transporter, partial [Myxococcales bacterium]|nr:MMPL family transporter [Myxococcales bacterium]
DGPRAGEKALAAAVAEVLQKKAGDSEVDDLMVGLTTPLDEIYKRERSRARVAWLLRVAKIGLPEGRRGERLRVQAATALLDLDSPRILVSAAGAGKETLAVRAGGMPVLHRALSRSAVRNQLGSLASALLPVLLIMMLLFRSLTAGLLASVPTLVTLLVIYGGMALIGVHLDIGTAMLACIILGAGVDYAVHLVAAWRGADVERAARNAVTRTGTAIWTNALAVAIGFGMLTLGKAKPLQNVGGLTAVAMIVAATATFALIPALARRSRYGRVDAASAAPREAALASDELNDVAAGRVSPADATND